MKSLKDIRYVSKGRRVNMVVTNRCGKRMEYEFEIPKRIDLTFEAVRSGIIPLIRIDSGGHGYYYAYIIEIRRGENITMYSQKGLDFLFVDGKLVE